MKLDSGMTLVMFTLKLLGLFNHGWLVVFSPLIACGLLTITVAGLTVLSAKLR